MKKRYLSILFVCIIAIALTGCGESNKKEENNKSNTSESTEKGTTTNTKTESVDEANGDYVYMFDIYNRMKKGGNPASYGKYYLTAEEAMKEYGYDMTIRHNLENGKIKESDVGFKIDGKIYYLNGQNPRLYEENKKKLQNIFGSNSCSDGKSYFQCKNDSISVTTWPSGAVEANVGKEYCHSEDDFSKCGTH